MEAELTTFGAVTSGWQKEILFHAHKSLIVSLVPRDTNIDLPLLHTELAVIPHHKTF